MNRILSAIAVAVIAFAINVGATCGIAWVLPLGGLEYGIKLIVIIFMYGACQIVLFDPISAAIKDYRGHK